MIESPSHPAASADFLSKRHDGELSAADFAAFEAHRRDCPECAAAVEDFDRALAAYRAADVAPAASDISARILRKIRTASPSRRPFGVMFGIDVRWAGALAAALIVVIIMAPVFSRREHPFGAARPSAPESPIAAYVLDEEQPSRETSAAPRAAEKAKETEKKEVGSANGSVDLNARPPGQAPAPAEAPARSDTDEAYALDATKLVGDAAGARSNPPPPQPAAPAASAARAEKPAQFPRRQSAAAPAGGEAASDGSLGAAPEIRISVRAVDGQGGAPEVVRAPTEASLADLKGREFLLVVDGGGNVLFVEEQGRERRNDQIGAAAPLDKSKESKDSTSAAQETLKQLAFHPGDRSRRLVVRVE